MIEKTIITAAVNAALAEDVGTGDITAQLLSYDLNISAQILTREPMVLCGKAWVMETLRQIDPTIVVTWYFAEGEFVTQAAVLCQITGNARAILTAERTALNFLQILAATATQTRAYLQQISGTNVKLLDTRKTIPGLRHAQKYAVACVGACNQRMGLYDAFLIKENHIQACGSITNAIMLARATKPDLLVEVEVETLAELQEALEAMPDRVLLDNFDLASMRAAVLLNQPKICSLEASGGINLANIRAIAETGVDYISVGSITKNIQAIDLTLLVE